MALGGLVVALVVVDSLLRRIVLPLVLLSAVIFRYNLVSFMYLLLLLIIFLLPGPRVKSRRASSVVFLVLLLVFSGAATFAQVLFQISLRTSYNEELRNFCESTESIWRQFGFVQFSIPAVDVVRLLLPDVIIFIVTLVTLIIDIVVVIKLKPASGENESSQSSEEPEVTEVEPVDSERGDTEGVLSDIGYPPYPKNIQCYWRVPKEALIAIEFGIFVLLGLSGIAVPSLISFVYYAVFIVLLVVWSIHMRLAVLVRILRTLLTLYSGVHLLVLHLFQFSSVQFYIDQEPCSTSNCTTTFLAKLFGLTPIVMTNCTRPTELLLLDGLNFTVFVNPALVFILFWLLATDLRMWIFTPQILWKLEFLYYLPVQDQSPSSSVKFILKNKSKKSQILKGTKSYGTMGPGGLGLLDGEGTGASEVSSPDLMAPLLTKKKKLQNKIWLKVQSFARSLWTAILRVAFIFTVVAMMVWSVLYPSWPSLVFLLWACGIWLIPTLNPKDSVIYTSPLLVVYSTSLLIVQYAYSLDLTLMRNIDVVVECKSGTEEGCKSIALLVKTLLTVIFFVSFYEFIRIVKIKVPLWWAKHRHQADGEMLLTALHDDEVGNSPGESEISDSAKATAEARSHLYSSAYRLLCTYWVVVVVGAFLLVMLTGDPSLLKSIYLVCFFLFMVTYQVAERFWFFFCFPVWWLLVLYAALHLTLIYTYPFTVINKLWMKAYNTTLSSKNITFTSNDLFESIGFTEYNDERFQTLLVTLVPPAVFIAVMALQLRFFRPRSIKSTSAQVSSQATLDVYSLLPKAFHKTLNKLNEFDVEDSDDEDDADDENNDSDDEIHRISPSGHSIKSSAIREAHPKLYSCYRLSKYCFNKARQITVDLNNIFWRFLELHLHKIVAFTLFATSISQISAVYWVLLVFVLIIVPLPFFNPLMYPVVTLYLGLVSTTKMVYNLPIMSGYYHNFSQTRPCNVINEVVHNGTVYNETYSPRINDTNWIGLHPTENFSRYISLPVVCCLLLSFWFSVRRYQARYYKSQNIVVKGYEHRSLFLNVTREEAEISTVASIKYLVNHFFEMYGIEVCLAMLAITVAVRIDVYGVIYVIALGILCVVRRRLPLIWFIYLLLHGALLAVQYFFLLGAPPSVCYNKPNSTVYPWSNLTIENSIALKKWLFIPADTLLILDSNLLYADFLVYVVVCLQFIHFLRNPLKQGIPQQTDGTVPNFYESKYWIDYIKVFVFQYSFWFSLFLLFFTAAYRISLFGVIYLLVGFYFLFQGQQMLMNRKITKLRSWAILRFATWFTLLLRVSLQILGCVYLRDVDDCLLVLLINGACTKPDYYGSLSDGCSDGPRNLGLWIDALNFIVVTLQIIIFDTQYADIVKLELTRKVEEAQSFREVFDSKIKDYQETQNLKKEREFNELVERTGKLVVSEKKIDHLLYAGVRIPEDIQICDTKEQSSASKSRSEEVDHDLLDSTSITSNSTPCTNLNTGREKEKTTARKIYEGFLEVTDWLIEQLEQSSLLYREVVFSIKESLSPTHTTTECKPISLERTTYGSVEDAPQLSASVAVVEPTTVVEVHESSLEQGSRQLESGKTDKPAPTEKQSKKKKKKKTKKAKSVEFADSRRDVLIEELHIEPTVSERDEIQQFEGELEKKALKATSRIRRLSTAIYYFLLAHSDYPVFFFIILNVILNGNVLSLVYVILLYTWGLLSIPWPTKKFWLILIFYTMSVLLIKYAFQFHEIPYWETKFDPNSGLYPPLVLGILHRDNFFTNAVWDILLLIALLLHRGLLIQYGIWDSGPKQNVVESFTNFFQQLWHDFKVFFARLFDPTICQGAKDYYAIMLFFDILCFITIAAGVNSFGFGIQTKTVEDLTAVADFVKNNNVPLTFVALLLLQFLSMVIDRAIYVRRSLPARFAFQMFLLVGWHAGLFFVLPSEPLTNRPFTSNVAAQCLYFFKSCYFIASSFQIVAGYPTRIVGYLLASSYNIVSWLAFQVYRLIPLLPELRETVDWTFTNTSLSLINWFKVQEIYSLIYLVKVQRTREKSYPRDLGEKQSWLVKIFAGGLLLIGLVLLIWLPLLLISVISQASEVNPPVEVDIKLSIGGFQPLVQLTVQNRDIKQLNSAEYSKLAALFKNSAAYPVFSREFQQEDFRRVLFPGQSTSLWTISPPSRELLLNQLIGIRNESLNETISVDFLWSIKRAPSSSSNTLETVSGVTSQKLSQSSNVTLEALIDSLTSETPMMIEVNFTNLYPTLIRAPSSEQSTNFTQLSRFLESTGSVRSNVSCVAILNKSNNTNIEWWSLEQKSGYVVTDSETPEQLEMIIYSERVAPQILSIISGFGIIGLYVSVVLVIGRFIRTYIADLPYRLAVDEILNPDPLLKLCHDIYTVRESGELMLEEILVGKLFYIFRSSERIVKITENLKEKTD